MSVYYRHLIEDGLLLDTYPNAAVAYSLRKLREGYTRVFNLWNYSEQMQQGEWVKEGTSITNDALTAPDGSTTADIVFETSTIVMAHSFRRIRAVTIGEEYTISFWVKANGRDFINVRSALQMSTDGVTQPTSWVDLSSGTVVSNSGSFRVAPTITAAPNGWYKVEFGTIASSTGTFTNFQILTSPDGISTNYVGDVTKGVAVWGVQLTLSTSILPYQKTVVTPDNGNAIRVRRASDSSSEDIGFDSSGELDTATLLNFVGWNLWSYSEQMQQGVWPKTNVTSTTDTVIAPDGNTTGDVILETIALGTHTISRTQVVLAGEEYTISFWVRPEGRNFISIRSAINLSTNNISQPVAFFNLTTGTKISDNGLFRVAPTITVAPNGWFFITYGVIANSSTTSTALQLNLSTDGTTTSYVGDPLLGVGVWGIQITKSSTIRPYRQTLAIAEGQGTITTWYDQSGNGRNGTQGTFSLQCIIVSNGNLITNNGKTSTLWSNDSYGISSFNTEVPIVSTYVARRNGIGTAGQMTTFSNNGTTVASVFRWISTNNNMTTYLNTLITHSPNNTFTGDYLLTTYKRTDEYVSIRRNNIEFGNAGISTGNGALNSFGNSNGSGTTGYVNEAVLWFQNYVTLIPNIETQINEYYGIY